jgi:hypothetical protein
VYAAEALGKEIDAAPTQVKFSKCPKFKICFLSLKEFQ